LIIECRLAGRSVRRGWIAWLVQSCCRRRLGDRLINPHRCPVASWKVDLKLSVIDSIISRLDSEYLPLLDANLLCCAEFAFLLKDYGQGCKRGLEPLALKLRIKRIIGSARLALPRERFLSDQARKDSSVASARSWWCSRMF
jgi:hypothetical protein